MPVNLLIECAHRREVGLLSAEHKKADSIEPAVIVSGSNLR